MGDKRIERRKFIRFNFGASIKFRLPNSIDENIKGKTKNFSAEGLCVVAQKEIPRDKDIELDVSLPGKKRPVRIHGKVMWTQRIKPADKGAPGRFEAGVKLYVVDKDDENTFLRHYCERMVDNLSEHLKP